MFGRVEGGKRVAILVASHPPGEEPTDAVQAPLGASPEAEVVVEGVLRGGHLYAEAQLALLLVDVEDGPEGLPESRQQPLDGGLPLGPHRHAAVESFVRCCFRTGSGGYETELCAGLYALGASSS